MLGVTGGRPMKIRGLDLKSLGLVSLVLAALAGIFQGAGLYSGIIFFGPVLFSHAAGSSSVPLAPFLSLFGLTVDLIAAGLGMSGGWLMYQVAQKGPPLVFTALLTGVVGETLLGLGGMGDYAFIGVVVTGSLFWIVLLLLGSGVLWTSLHNSSDVSMH